MPQYMQKTGRHHMSRKDGNIKIVPDSRGIFNLGKEELYT